MTKEISEFYGKKVMITTKKGATYCGNLRDGNDIHCFLTNFGTIDREGKIIQDPAKLSRNVRKDTIETIDLLR